MVSLGGAYLALGSQDQAFESLTRGIELAHELGRSDLEASILNDLANFHASRKDYDRAARAYDQCLKAAFQTGYHALAARASINAAAVDRNLGNHARAYARLEQALELIAAAGANHDAIYDLINLALSRRESGPQPGGTGESVSDRSLPILQKAARLAESIEDVRAVSYARGVYRRLAGRGETLPQSPRID